MPDRQGEPDFFHAHVDLNLPTKQQFVRAPLDYLK
jgi:hypothetical protein